MSPWLTLAFSLAFWIMVIFLVEWIVMLILGQQNRKVAAKLAEAARLDAEIVSEMLLLVEDLRRFDPERDEVFELAGELLRTHRDQAIDMGHALDLEASRKPNLLILAPMVRITSRSLRRIPKARWQQRRMRDLDLGDDDRGAT